MFNFFIFKLIKFLINFIDSPPEFTCVLNIKIEKMRRLYFWEKVLFEF